MGEIQEVSAEITQQSPETILQTAKNNLNVIKEHYPATFEALGRHVRIFPDQVDNDSRHIIFLEILNPEEPTILERERNILEDLDSRTKTQLEADLETLVQITKDPTPKALFGKIWDQSTTLIEEAMQDENRPYISQPLLQACQNPGEYPTTIRHILEDYQAMTKAIKELSGKITLAEVEEVIAKKSSQ